MPPLRPERVTRTRLLERLTNSLRSGCKLDAHSRKQAVNKAREFGLLP